MDSASDLHGNLDHASVLVREANSRGVDALLLGGDLAPRREQLIRERKLSSLDGVVEGQRDWCVQQLFPLLFTCNCPVYAILGNSDAIANIGFLQRQCKQTNVSILNNEWAVLKSRDGKESHLFLCYSCVPLSHHRMKDWERVDRKIDFKDPIEGDARGSEVKDLNGLLSKWDCIIKHRVSTEAEHSIEADLERLCGDISKEDMRKSIWMVHTPPYGGPLDVITCGEHKGSVALKEYITACQPLITLHGHIHETVRMSKAFAEKHLDVDTVSYGTGNNFREDTVHCILVSTSHPQHGERLNFRAKGLQKEQTVDRE